MGSVQAEYDYIRLGIVRNHLVFFSIKENGYGDWDDWDYISDDRDLFLHAFWSKEIEWL